LVVGVLGCGVVTFWFVMRTFWGGINASTVI
jgi:hypothetical protein